MWPDKNVCTFYWPASQCVSQWPLQGIMRDRWGISRPSQCEDYSWRNLTKQNNLLIFCQIVVMMILQSVMMMVWWSDHNIFNWPRIMRSGLLLLVRMISMMAGQFAEYTSCLAASQASSSQSFTALFWTSVPDSAYLILLIPSKYCVFELGKFECRTVVKNHLIVSWVSLMSIETSSDSHIVMGCIRHPIY